MKLASLLDTVIEAPVIPSFTRLGYDARRKLDDWQELDGYDLTGQVVVLTGATSGIGKAAAVQFAKCGATLLLVGRTETKNQRVAKDIADVTGNTSVHHFAADMGDLDQVRTLASHVLESYDRLDVLIHNAGALTAERQTAPDGTEATVSSQVVGPFLLTGLLLDRLADSAPARVLTMSSGGMYSAPLTLTKLEMGDADYNGTEQYARAKRAQVTLNQEWSERFANRGISFHALHPGWADTPGVDASLPTFSKIVGPLLRTPAQGADTLVWLAADDAGTATSGEFWHDRRTRSIHKLSRTRKSDTAERRGKLWTWVCERSGLTPT